MKRTGWTPGALLSLVSTHQPVYTEENSVGKSSSNSSQSPPPFSYIANKRERERERGIKEWPAREGPPDALLYARTSKMDTSVVDIEIYDVAVEPYVITSQTGQQQTKKWNDFFFLSEWDGKQTT